MIVVCPCCQQHVSQDRVNHSSPTWDGGLRLGRKSWHDFNRLAESENLVPLSALWRLALRFWSASAARTAMRVLYNPPRVPGGDEPVL